MSAPNVEPESEICSRCGEGTSFEWSDGEQGFVSVCCTRPPMALDREPPDA